MLTVESTQVRTEGPVCPSDTQTKSPFVVKCVLQFETLVAVGWPSVIMDLPVGFFISTWRVRSLRAVCEQSSFPQLPKTFHTQLSDLKLYRSKSRI